MDWQPRLDTFLRRNNKDFIRRRPIICRPCFKSWWWVIEFLLLPFGILDGSTIQISRTWHMPLLFSSQKSWRSCSALQWWCRRWRRWCWLWRACSPLRTISSQCKSSAPPAFSPPTPDNTDTSSHSSTRGGVVSLFTSRDHCCVKITSSHLDQGYFFSTAAP